ncbi:MAG: 5'/3'-nucleotidase SurE [Desulfobulbus propionicus]|nr:MAG: 5'/3'-nucleotidase SurE [Desulfobulbus propionicus]
MNRPLILVTNDDGVHAPGVRTLFDAVTPLGECYLIAPLRDNSAVSHSLTIDRPLRVIQLEDRVYTLDGTPTDCVNIGINKVLPRHPDLLVSGINSGHNLGDDISYSGTVSAAIEGTMYAVASMAFSLGGGPVYDFEVAGSVAWKLAAMALQFELPPGALLNVNIPPLPAGKIKGIRFTRQGRKTYENAIQETEDPWGRPHYWIGGGTVHWTGADNTDEKAIRDGFISITPIQLDLTNLAGLDYLHRHWPM